MSRQKWKITMVIKIRKRLSCPISRCRSRFQERLNTSLYLYKTSQETVRQVSQLRERKSSEHSKVPDSIISKGNMTGRYRRIWGDIEMHLKLWVIRIQQAQNLVEWTSLLAALNLAVGVRNFHLVHSIINKKTRRKVRKYVSGKRSTSGHIWCQVEIFKS
jgi:hypothetical protein